MLVYKKGCKQLKINDIEITTVAPIWHVEEFNDLFLVTVDPYYSDENIFAFNKLGTLVWTIQKHPYPPFNQESVKGYSGTEVNELGLIAISLTNFIINEKTGQIIGEVSEYK